MKNWLKTQFTTFPNKDKFATFYTWAITIFLVSLGFINIWYGTTIHVAYGIAGIWQLYTALIYFSSAIIIENYKELGKMYGEWIDMEAKYEQSLKDVIQGQEKLIEVQKLEILKLRSERKEKI